jgi:hypothetical protein
MKKKLLIKTKKSFKNKYKEFINSQIDENEKIKMMLRLMPLMEQYNIAIESNEQETINKYEKEMNNILYNDYTNDEDIYHENYLNCLKCNYLLQESKEGDFCLNCGLVSKNKNFQITQKEINKNGYTLSKKIKYTKKNHLLSKLKNFQSHFKKNVPDNVYMDIVEELNKQRIKDYSKLKPQHVKEILKKLKYNTYYDACVHILNKLNNRQSFVLPVALQEQIYNMFSKVENIWSKYKLDNKKSNLPFDYILNKFFQMLNLEEYANLFPMLKSRSRIREHDFVFKKVIEELQQTDDSFNWIFLPSL